MNFQAEIHLFGLNQEFENVNFYLCCRKSMVQTWVVYAQIFVEHDKKTKNTVDSGEKRPRRFLKWFWYFLEEKLPFHFIYSKLLY